MTKVKITEAVTLPNDVLQVTGEVEGQQVIASGWQSAMSNFYPPEAYDEDGLLRLKSGKKGVPGDPEVAPRSMNKAERRAYCEGLLLEAAAALPVDITNDV